MSELLHLFTPLFPSYSASSFASKGVPGILDWSIEVRFVGMNTLLSPLGEANYYYTSNVPSLPSNGVQKYAPSLGVMGSNSFILLIRRPRTSSPVSEAYLYAS